MADNDKNQKESILESAKSFVMILLIAILCFYALMSNTSNKKQMLPMPFGVGAAVVLSGSMEPEFSVGDLIIFTERSSYEKGDVVVFDDDSMIVTHRIVSITKEEVITKGDANNAEDFPIKPEQIKGKVLFVIPLVGYAINAIKTPSGAIFLLALALLLFVFSSRSKKQSDDEDKEDIETLKKEIEKLKQQNEQ